jgi:hypothetical protein
VYPGGSYAKGTTVGTRSDVDILVVLNGLPTTNYERWLHMVLSKLRALVELEFQGQCSLPPSNHLLESPKLPRVHITDTSAQHSRAFPRTPFALLAVG